LSLLPLPEIKYGKSIQVKPLEHISIKKENKTLGILADFPRNG
jgi:hypothetical protein